MNSVTNSLRPAASRLAEVGLSSLAAVLLSVSPAPTFAQAGKDKPADKLAAPAATVAEPVMLNFVNADIESVVRAIGKVTQRNFVIDPRVKGVINVVSSSPVAPPLAYEIMLAALRLQGFTAVQRKGVTVILPESDAKYRTGAVSVSAPGKTAQGEHMITEVFNLKYESASQLIPIVRPLVAPNNPVTAYPGTNTLVITDYAENIRRIAQLIESIDQPSAFEPIIIPVKHGSASELAAAVTRILNDGMPGTPAGSAPEGVQKVTVIAEPRSNSLILRSDNPTRVARVRALIERLDSPGAAPGNIHVVYLRNAEAVKVAQTLRAIVAGDLSNLTAGATPTGSLNPTAAPGAAGAAATATAASAPSSGQTSPTGQGIIQADAASNALIVTASDAVFNNLRTVIEKLDVKRAQVHIEALIAEVTADKATELGVQWQGVSNASNRTAIVTGTNFSTGGNNLLSSAIGAASGAPVAPGSGLNIAVLNRVILSGGKEVINLSMLAHALEADSNANILSTPNLLTLDNEEARIVIGQNVPFVTGQYAQTGTSVTATPFQTIERKDVGLTLKVKPQISEGGAVRLQVFQEVSSVDSTSVTSASGLITNKRSLESTVLLQDGQTIVLGGLIQDSISDGTEKIPLLGDIPVFGVLFSYEKKRRAKTNLMVFLRPTILRDEGVAHRLTQDRYGFVIGQQKEAAAGDALRNNELLNFPAGKAGAGTAAATPVAPNTLKNAPDK